jgi:hypothetical protein
LLLTKLVIGVSTVAVTFFIVLSVSGEENLEEAEKRVLELRPNVVRIITTFSDGCDNQEKVCKKNWFWHNRWAKAGR